MLRLYDHLETIIEVHQDRQRFFEAHLPYFANEIMETLAIADADEIALALKRTFEAFSILHIPVHHNFKRVFRYDGENLITDWMVSSLAHYLIIINCNPANERVAKAQLYFALTNPGHK
ncbi:MAG: hypothetical protein ABI763_04125 [Bacteroidota bacterium]